MNWLTWALKIFSLAPYVIQEVERIHGELPGSSKKQIAMDALSVATNVALTVAPTEQQPAIQAANNLASNVVDGTVALLNATGAMQQKTKTQPDPQAIAQAATAAAGPAAPAAPSTNAAADPAAPQQVHVYG